MGRRANLQKSDGGRINCVPPPVGGGAIYALGIGSDLASPAPGGTGASLTGPPASPAPGGTGPTQFRAHKLPPPLRGEGRNLCDLRRIFVGSPHGSPAHIPRGRLLRSACRRDFRVRRENPFEQLADLRTPFL